MRLPFPVINFLGAASALAILAACSASGTQSSSGIPAPPISAGQNIAAQPSAASDLLDPLEKHPVKTGVYVAMAQQANFYALPDSGNAGPSCTLVTDFSKGIAVDPSGKLWIPNASGVINSYRKGSCKPAARTLQESTGTPNDIAFSNAGTAYVAANGSTGFVLVFPKGSSQPSATLSDPSVTEVRGVAVDSAGDVFASCVKERERSCVIEFNKGKMPGKFIDIQVGISDGLEVDASQNLIVIDPGSRQAEIFAPPYKGAPKSAFALRGSSEFGKVDATNTNFYASNFSSGTVDVFTYPAGVYEYSISNGVQVDGVWGVAVYPASKN